MARRDAEHGAGYAGARADEIARLAAAVLLNSRSAICKAIGGIDRQREQGNCPCSGEELRRRIEPLLNRAFPVVTNAEALPSGYAGDLMVVTGGGAAGTHRVEIKAQLEKKRVNELTQADWVRNGTDALRFLYLNDASFRDRLSAANRDLLQAKRDEVRGWTFPELWLADVAGLTCFASRVFHEVRTPEDLRDFLSRKYLLHLCAERDQLIPLADIPAIAKAMTGEVAVTYVLKKNRASECAVPVCVGGGETVFTYHIYPATYTVDGTFVGRHKLHGTTLTRHRIYEL